MRPAAYRQTSEASQILRRCFVRTDRSDGRVGECDFAAKLVPAAMEPNERVRDVPSGSCRFTVADAAVAPQRWRP